MVTTVHPPARRRLAQLLAFVVLTQVLGAALVVVPEAPPAGAAPGIQLSKDAPSSVLAGEEATYRLTVTNPGDAIEFNVSISDVLPFGATFVPGSVTPASAGNPTTAVDPTTGQQVLVWSNLTDIGPGGRYQLEFKATLGASGQLVGEFLVNTAYVAAQTDPRVVPDFDSSGIPVPGSYTESANASRTTEVTALDIRKTSTDTPEGELLRGVHDHRSTYTLTVTNNDVAATTGIEVVDHLPAGLEFLGCGDADNTAPGVVEYPGAPRLGVPPLNPGPSCLTPTRVETVTDPAPIGGVGFPPGVYTKVTWSLPDLAASASATIRYVTGIPLRQNVDGWPGAVPDPASGLQGSNLDNNTGASTRELANESSLTNRAVTTGTYTGPTSGSPVVGADTSHTVSVEDVRMRKAVSPARFTSDGGADVATFTITVETSEYVNGSGIVVTDVLPDGYCPLGGSANYAPGGPTECDPGGGSAPSVPFDSVTYDPATGGYTIRFDPLAVTGNDTTTATFQARMRDVYTGGSRNGFPTAAGDGFTNQVSLTGTTTPIPGTGGSGTQTVGDSSSATQDTSAPAIDKELKPRSTTELFSGDPLVDCATATPPAYGEPSSFSQAQLTFRQGDQVCFKLRVDFPDDIHTRAPVVSDFFPVDTSYLVNGWAATSANTVTVGPFSAPTSTPGSATWTLGDDQGGVRFAQPGDVFEVVLAVTVLEPSPPPKPDLRGNLMKLRTEDTNGTVLSSRDAVDFDVAPGANLALTKGVYAVDAPPSGPNPAGTDGKPVQEGSVATYRIDLQNLGRDGYPGANFSVRGVRTWDVLPLGIDCADVADFGVVTHGSVPPATLLSPSPLPGGIVACTNPGQAGHPAVDPAYGDSAAQSVVVWTFPSPDVTETYSIFLGETMTLTYEMALPDRIGVSTRFDNSAAVQSFRSFTNIVNETSEYYPQDNIDPSVQPLENVQAADDPSWVVTSDALISKAVTTQFDAPNNNIPDQATIGEQVTFTIGVTVPPRTSVYNGVLSDPMPTGLTFLSAAAGFSATGASPATDPLPAGFTLDPANGTLTFPPEYQNASATPQLFQVTVTARVSTLAGNTHGTVRTNTASFNSTTAEVGGTPLPTRTARSSVTIVEPNPRIQKSASPTTVIGGQTVGYTLTASNANGRPPSHDTEVIDCLPVQVAFGAFTSIPAGTTASQGLSTGGDGCALGQTRIQWDVGTVLAGTVNRQVLRYTGIVDPAAVGGATYTNTATLTGGSLDNPSPTPDPNERIYTRTAQATVTVTNLELTKGVIPTRATIGDTALYGITVRIPANTTYYDAAVTDVLPAGQAASAPRFQTLSVTCTIAVTNAPCTGLDPAFGTALTASGQTVGWSLGDIPGDPTNDRFVTVAYATVVLNDPANTTGANRQNAATARWNLVDGGGPVTTVTEALALTNSKGPAVADLGIVEPQLTIDKAVSDTTPTPGETFTYSITVTNGSGATVSEAYDIEVDDDVPAGVVVTGSISNGGTLSGDGPSGNGTIAWTNLGPLAPGESVTLTYDARLAASALIDDSPLTNTADITKYFSLPTVNPDRRQYDGPTDTATVTPQFPRFSTAKSTPAGSTASIGEPFAWRFDVTNTGGADGSDVAVVDTLPANWTYDAGSARLTIPQPGGTPVQVEPTVTTVGAVQTLTWPDIGDLAAGGGAARVDLTATPGPGVVSVPGVGLSTPNTNSVTASGKDATGASGNLDGTYSAGPATAPAYIPSADLAIIKAPATQSANAGGTATWTLTVTNNGLDPSAQPFRVVDVLPPGLTLVSATGTGWACVNPGTADSTLCTRSTPAAVNAGESLPPITVVATMPIGQPEGTDFTNTATVYPTTYDPVPANNTDSATVTLRASADLAIDKTTSQPVVAGTNLTYTLAVTNLGPDPSRATPADPIVVADPLPSPLTFVSAAGTDWACSAVGRDVTCNRTTELPQGAAPPITVVAALPADFTGTLTNTATVTPELTYDPVPGNNTDTAIDPVTTSADLAIVKSHTGTPALGAPLDFTLAVTNLGPSVATGVAVTDAVPAGLTPTAASGTGWTCTITGQDVSCSLGTDLPAGPAAPITLTATVGAAAVPSVINPGVVSSVTPDPNPANNTSRDPVEVAPLVDLTIDKSHTGEFLVGGRGVFTLVVGNNGPTRDPGPLTVTDTLPAGLSLVSGTGTGWTCTAAGQDVTCTNPATLEVGATSSIELTVDVLPAAFPEVTNPATVTSPATDTDPDNNADTDTVAVRALVDLSVTKTGSVTAGRTATWTIAVRNAGPSGTVGPITLTDTLPGGLGYVSAGGPGWTCSEAGGTITCSYGASLAAGATATVTVVSTISTGAGTTITNTATATTEGSVGSTSVGAGSVSVPRAGLAFTGSDWLPLMVLGTGLVLLGALALWALPRGGIRPVRWRRAVAGS